jgi:O-antigen ligase
VELLVFLCTGLFLVLVALRKQPVVAAKTPVVITAMCCWGAVQLAAHWTVVPADTADAVLYWLAAACFAWLGLEVCASREGRLVFLKLALTGGAVICILGLVQLFTSDGRVFWWFPSGYDSGVIGPFVSRNNYAAFVELLLPVALVLSFKERRRARVYFGLAAALVATVIASGSRAGASIVIAETAFVFLMQVLSGGGKMERKWAFFAVLLPAFTIIVGYQFLWERFSTDQDPFQFRREFVESSAAMVRSQPLHGFGFGTWPSAYRQFAVIDTGLTVNHAHNEWAQWAAEGGLPALGLMMAVLAFCLPGAIRSVWGLGIVAVFIHSLVDYPFLRLGLAAWVFTFLGALAGYSHERHRLERGWGSLPRPAGIISRCLAMALIPLLGFAAFQAGRAGWADHLYNRGTRAAVARAAALRPDRAEYQFAQVETDRDHEIGHLRAAVALNPYLTEASILLSSQLELRGDAAQSEAVLLELARRDRQYAPAWSLANFYFRAGRPEEFWIWVRKAAIISPGGMQPLFDLCLAMTPDVSVVSSRLALSRRSLDREFLSFLINRRRFSDAHAAALRLVGDATSDDREPLLDYVDRSIDAGRIGDAADVWNGLCLRKLVDYSPVSGGVVVNGDFTHPALKRGFDWQPGDSSCAVAAQTSTNGAALELFLPGNRPENCEIYRQYLVPFVRKGFSLRFEYRTVDLPDPPGVRWSLAGEPDYEFRTAAEWTEGEWRLPAVRASGKLSLQYRRSNGSTRQEGILFLRRVRLEPEVTRQSGGPRGLQ